MSSTQRSLTNQRSPTKRMLAGAAMATVALGLLGAGGPAVLAADHGQDSWWYNNKNMNWQGASTWHDNGDSWRYRNSRTGYTSYRYDGGRPYYYAPPPTYYYLPTHVDRPTLSVGFTF
jgi:hypothetical protein